MGDCNNLLSAILASVVKRAGQWVKLTFLVLVGELHERSVTNLFKEGDTCNPLFVMQHFPNRLVFLYKY